MSQSIYGVPCAFCWAEVFTHNENNSKSFYHKLFAWSYSETSTADKEGMEGMHYTHASIAEGAVAGMMQITPEMVKHGLRPHWASYIAVSDIDKTVELAKLEKANVVMEATEITGAGRMAILQDPTGAFISLWQSVNEYKSIPRECFGIVGWNELRTSDLIKAKKFYETVFGWQSQEDKFDNNSYISFTLDGKYVAGMMALPKEMGRAPSHWGIYFTTKNIEESRRIAKDAGAIEISSLIDMSGVGKMILIKDPEDAIFSLFEWAKE